MERIKYAFKELFGLDYEFSRRIIVGGMLLVTSAFCLRYNFDRFGVENKVSSRLETQCEHEFFRSLNEVKCRGNIYIYDDKAGEVRKRWD